MPTGPGEMPSRRKRASASIAAPSNRSAAHGRPAGRPGATRYLQPLAPASPPGAAPSLLGARIRALPGIFIDSSKTVAIFRSSPPRPDFFPFSVLLYPLFLVWLIEG